MTETHPPGAPPGDPKPPNPNPTGPGRHRSPDQRDRPDDRVRDRLGAHEPSVFAKQVPASGLLAQLAAQRMGRR